MENIDEYNYDTTKMLGHGAFAVVYRGRRRVQPYDEVAVKCISRKNVAKNPAILNKEIKILQELSELKHENVVALHKCIDGPNTVYMIMEYCYGGDLSDYLNYKKLLDEYTVKLFVRQIAEALKILYEHNVVHRDLKPQNILLSINGEKYPPPNQITLKIADFGFARYLYEGAMAVTMCGSPMYMAPEVLMNKQYNRKADLWSLGTIIYQCLFSKAPFSASTPNELKKFYEDIKDLSPTLPRNHNVSTILQDLLFSLLKKKPEDRISHDKFFQHPFVNLERKDHNINRCPAVGAEAPLVKQIQRRSRNAVADLPPEMVEAKHESASVRPVNAKMTRQNANLNKNINTKRKTDMTDLTNEEEDGFVIVPSDIPGEYDPNRKNKNYYGRTTPTSVRRVSNTSPVHQKLIKAASSPLQVANKTGRYLSNVPGVGSGSADSPRVSEIISMPRSTISRDSTDNIESSKDSKVSTESKASTRSDVSRKISDTLLDVSSLSPPTVQFCFATPPAGTRRRSSSCSSSAGLKGIPMGNSPQHTNPLLSPAIFTDNSERDICGNVSATPHHVMTFQSSLQQIGKDNQAESMEASGFVQRSETDPCLPGNLVPNNQQLVKYMSSSPENLLHTAPGFNWTASQNMASFYATPLSEETLMEKEHTETLAKMHFVIALVDCIFELAKSRSFFGTSPSLSTRQESSMALASLESQRKTEQLVLYVRALQMLSSAIIMAKNETTQNRLQSSPAVENATAKMNSKFSQCYTLCRELNSSGKVLQMDAESCAKTADRLIYLYAVEMCQSAAVDELFGKFEPAFKRYQTAHILLHALAQFVPLKDDQALITKYKYAVESRLIILSSKGIIHAVTTTDDL